MIYGATESYHQCNDPDYYMAQSLSNLSTYFPPKGLNLDQKKAIAVGQILTTIISSQ